MQNGVIDLDDPTNFNVSMFTIVLTIGQFPVTVSQPVAVPSTPGVSYGSGGGGWTGGGGGGGVGTPRPVSGCVTGCSNIVIIKTPSGQTIPGVIIGAQLGARVASAIPQKVLERGLGVLFLLIAALTIGEVVL